MTTITHDLIIITLTATLIITLPIYLSKSKSYSNSYLMAALKRRNKKPTIANTIPALFLDRSLLALLIYRLNNRINNPVIGKLITNIGFILTGVEIFYNAKIGYRVQVWHGQGTVIGQNAVIGDDSLILHQVTLGSGFVVIGRSVKIGAGAKILGNISIGDNSIIGANSVITKSLSPNSITRTPIEVHVSERASDIKFGTRDQHDK